FPGGDGKVRVLKRQVFLPLQHGLKKTDSDKRFKAAVAVMDVTGIMMLLRIFSVSRAVVGEDPVPQFLIKRCPTAVIKGFPSSQSTRDHPAGLSVMVGEKNSESFPCRPHGTNNARRG